MKCTLLLLLLIPTSWSIAAAPLFFGAERYGVRPNHELLWRVPVKGATEVKVIGELPTSVTFDSTHRTFRGKIAKPGEYRIVLHASNDQKEFSEQTVTLCVGENICLTPPMGWNSWYSYSEAIRQENIEKVARLLVETGLANFGWTSVNIDDCWQGDRKGTGPLQPNPKFPNMKAMCDALHAQGLKAGIYHTPWIGTYAGFRGGSVDREPKNIIPAEQQQQPGQVFGSYPGTERRGQDHTGELWMFDIDAKQWAEWGFDYVKVDWKPNDIPTTERIAKDLRASGRDIILSLSNAAPIGNAKGLAKYAQLWRTTGDIQDHWGSLRSIGRAQLQWIPYQSVGHWNDPDILQIGRIGTPNQKNTSFRPSRLSENEQRYQMTLWCMLSAPLIISSDLESLSETTLALLTDTTLLALNQKYASAPLSIVENKPNYFILRTQISPSRAG
ncbi:MAG: glycoside hydrolase family 27 protein, partial [Kiritimatiellia bacterium]